MLRAPSAMPTVTNNPAAASGIRLPCAGRGGVVWRGWFPLGASHRIELSLHFFCVLSLVAVTWLLAQAFLPHVFPGWQPAVYWWVASSVALTDGLAGLAHELGHAVMAVSRG